LVVIPLVAAVISFAFIASQPARYKADATVVILPTGTGSSAVTVVQAVTDFQTALKSGGVAGDVSRKTGVPPGTISANLSSPQSSIAGITSSVVDVTYEGTNATTAAAVLRAATASALTLLASTSIAPAQTQVQAATADLKRALDAMTQFINDTGVGVPNVQYQVQVTQLANLRSQVDTLRSENRFAEAEAVAREVTRRVADLETLNAQIVRYTQITADQERAQAELTDSESALHDAQSRVTAAQAGVGVTPGRTERVARDPYVLRRLIPIVAVALVLAAGLVMLLELLRPSGRAPAGESPAPDTSPAGAAD
jgi:hypothetical protein